MIQKQLGEKTQIPRIRFLFPSIYLKEGDILNLIVPVDLISRGMPEGAFLSVPSESSRGAMRL